MATETLKIVIDTVYRGAQNAKRAEGDLEDVGAAADRGREGLQRYAEAAGAVTAGLGVLSGVAIFTYDNIDRGAALQNTQKRFERLSESIGTTSDALLGDMREATKGTVSDFELMDKAAQIMSLGLGDTHDEVLRLATVAGGLGWNMDQVTLTLANQSTMRLDALGLSIESVTGRAKELEDQGYSTEEAFQLAVIEAGEEKLLLLGDAADTTEGDLKRLEGQMQTLKDAFAVGTTEGAEPFLDVVDKLVVSLGGSGGLNEFVTKVGEGFVQGLFGPITMTTLAMQAAEERTGALNGVLLSMMGPLGTNIALWQALNEEIERFNGGATPDAKAGKTKPYYPPPPGQAGETYEYATGTSYHPGGMATVGEFGPERISLPAGARVTSTNVTHNDNRRMTLTNSRGVQRVVSSYLRNRSRRSRAV